MPMNNFGEYFWGTVEYGNFIVIFSRRNVQSQGQFNIGFTTPANVSPKCAVNLANVRPICHLKDFATLLALHADLAKTPWTNKQPSVRCSKTCWLPTRHE